MIVIFDPSDISDTLMFTSVLKYREQIWPGEDISWYSFEQNIQTLSRVSGIKEIGKIIYKDSWYICCPNISNTDQIFTTAPWINGIASNIAPFRVPPYSDPASRSRICMEQLSGTKIMGPWHPCLECSMEDVSVAHTLCNCLPYHRTVMLETHASNGQIIISKPVVEKIMEIVRSKWGGCNFMMVSPPLDKSLDGVFECSRLSLSQKMALFNMSDAMIGVGGTVSIATCSWGSNATVPRIELVASPLDGTKGLSAGPTTTVFDEEGLFKELPRFLSGGYGYVNALSGSPLVLTEGRRYSQNGEDGIIESVFRHMGTENKTFVEIGVGDGRQNNTRKLAEEEGWTGRWLSVGPVDHVPQGVNMVDVMVTSENINKLMKDLPHDLDLMSIDIDGNDYWVWDAIDAVSPRVVVMEYNPVLPPPTSKTIMYDPDFRWTFTDYFGASLCALYKLGRKKGYSLVCCDNSGTNAFFAKGLPNLAPEDAYVPFIGYGKNFRLGSDMREWVEV